MKKLKIISVFGTRPEASKMAPLIKKLEACEHIDSKVLVTAQHREMLDQVLSVFGISPDFDLNIMRGGQTLFDITTLALNGVGELLSREAPDLVLAHGDTSTTFAAALAAYYRQIKVGHVEAGLRTYDKYQPFPEEMNRLLTGCLADFNFAPTPRARDNLLREGYSPASVFVTGNTSVDAIAYSIRNGYVFENERLRTLDYDGRRVIVMTAHRRENLGEPHENVFRAARSIVDKYRDSLLVYPVHPNPLVLEPARRILGGHERIILTEPIGMLDMHNLMARAYLVLTDSGGLQEEAPAVHKPVVVLRNVTERPEGLAAGTLILAGTDEDKVRGAVSGLMDDGARYAAMANAKNPFGDGRASERILDAILYQFGINKKRPTDFE